MITEDQLTLVFSETTKMEGLLAILLAKDELLRSWVTSWRHPFLNSFALFITHLGEWGLIWLVLGILLLSLHSKLGSGLWRMSLALCLTALVSNVFLKPVVARPRPFAVIEKLEVLGQRPKTFSFPSGHASEAFAGAYALTQLYRRARWPSFTLASLIALSRVYIGVHYPLDIIFGSLIGLGCSHFVMGSNAPLCVRKTQKTWI